MDDQRAMDVRGTWETSSTFMEEDLHAGVPVIEPLRLLSLAEQFLASEAEADHVPHRINSDMETINVPSASISDGNCNLENTVAELTDTDRDTFPLSNDYSAIQLSGFDVPAVPQGSISFDTRALPLSFESTNTGTNDGEFRSVVVPQESDGETFQLKLISFTATEGLNAAELTTISKPHPLRQIRPLQTVEDVPAQFRLIRPKAFDLTSTGVHIPTRQRYKLSGKQFIAGNESTRFLPAATTHLASMVLLRATHVESGKSKYDPPTRNVCVYQ
jgi:hypothetical protein